MKMPFLRALATALSVAPLTRSAYALYDAREVSVLPKGASNASETCQLIAAHHSTRVYLPGSAGYTYETQRYWSATNYASPACVLVPQSALEVSKFVLAMRRLDTYFAMNGGGHMPVPLYNNANSNGILLSSSNLTTLSLRDKTTLSVGPGRHWNEVANYLTPHDLAAVGGRVGKVGVPGLLLGGGISYFSNQHGFAADNVVRYECVLANGLVVEPTATNKYSDLFWALKGGGNSFCLVTRFDIKVYSSPGAWLGVAQYDPSQRDQYLSAVYNFGRYGSQDPKAAVIPVTLTIPAANTTVYALSRFYDDATLDETVYENFTAPQMAPLVDTFEYQDVSTYLSANDVLQPDGLRQVFRTVSCVVNDTAVRYAHDALLGEIASLSSVVGLTASVTFQPIPKSFIQAGIDAGGNPQGIDITKAPYFWIVLNLTYNDAADDEAVYAFSVRFEKDVRARLFAWGLDVRYTYLNDAGYGQEVFQTYPEKNLARLKRIRAKYDPTGVYTHLMPGGWKVEDAQR